MATTKDKDLTDLEASALWHIKHLTDLPEPMTHYCFHPSRKWEADMAWPPQLVLLECEGGTRGKPIHCHNCGARVMAPRNDGSLYTVTVGDWSHSSPRGITRDINKYNAALELGWVVLRVTSAMLEEDPLAFLRTLVQVINARNGACPGATPDTPVEKAAALGFAMRAGWAPTTAEVAAALGYNTTKGAWSLLNKLGRVLPIAQDDDHLWRVVGHYSVIADQM